VPDIFFKVGLRHPLFIGKHHEVCETGVEPLPVGCHHAPLPPGPVPIPYVPRHLGAQNSNSWVPYPAAAVKNRACATCPSRGLLVVMLALPRPAS
jgi:hypothetical protein